MKIKMLKSSIRMLDLRTAKEPAKRADAIYSSRAWLGLMSRLKRERGNKCENCGAHGGRIYGDHVVELQDGGDAYSARNVKLLCASCHTLKTNQQRAQRQSERLSRPK